MSVNGRSFQEGDAVSLNGSRGDVYAGALAMVDASEGNESLAEFLLLCDKVRRLGVRTNADTPEDAARARAFGAEGIGLFRTEHMFYGKNSEAPLRKLRKMVFAQTQAKREEAIEELFPFVKNDIKATLEAMDGLPVTIRLLDPPLHEFVPHDAAQLDALAESLGMSPEETRRRADALKEMNPMMGHRGVRLGVTYPEVTRMQVRAVLEAAAELISAGKTARPEIMVPVVSAAPELDDQAELVREVHNEVCHRLGVKKIPHLVGTMVEIPRAALSADRLAETAEFISFGTNDLTQMTFGFSRDDIGGFLPAYLERGILPEDPFQSIDPIGVGELIRIGIERGRSTRPTLKVGICGEHGGEAKSVRFCHEVGMDYVSCSPFRVPLARLSAAQAVIAEKWGARKPAKRSSKKKASAKKQSARESSKKKASAKKQSARKSSKKKASAKKQASAKKKASRKRALSR